jgi:hypothetical protein
VARGRGGRAGQVWIMVQTNSELVHLHRSTLQYTPSAPISRKRARSASHFTQTAARVAQACHSTLPAKLMRVVLA